MLLLQMQQKRVEVVYLETQLVYQGTRAACSPITFKDQSLATTSHLRQDCSQRRQVTVISLKQKGFPTAQEQGLWEVSSTSKALVSLQSKTRVLPYLPITLQVEMILMMILGIVQSSRLVRICRLTLPKVLLTLSMRKPARLYLK